MSQLAVGSPAPDIALVTPDETAVHLSHYLSDGPVLLTFLRHFG